MRCLVAAITFALLMVSAPVHAADTGDVAAKAEPCKACHGEGGISRMENVPSLAGQPDLYTQWQLIFFKAGTRKNDVMSPLAEQLSNQDIRDLGAYFASLPPAPASAEKDDDPELTEAAKKASVGRRCAFCHLDTYAGAKAVARIAGQREDYLLKALRDYKSGARSGGAMAAMAEVTYSMSDPEIVALARYLSRL